MKKILLLTILTALVLPLVFVSATTSTNYTLTTGGQLTSHDIFSDDDVRLTIRTPDPQCLGLTETACSEQGEQETCFWITDDPENPYCAGGCSLSLLHLSASSLTTTGRNLNPDMADLTDNNGYPCVNYYGQSVLATIRIWNGSYYPNNPNKTYHLTNISDGVWSPYGPQGGNSLITLPVASVSEITDTASQFFTDTWGLIALFCAVPLGFYIIYRIGKLVKQRAD